MVKKYIIKGKGNREFEVLENGKIQLYFGDEYPTFCIYDDLEALYKVVEKSKELKKINHNQRNLIGGREDQRGS